MYFSTTNSYKHSIVPYAQYPHAAAKSTLNEQNKIRMDSISSFARFHLHCLQLSYTSPTNAFIVISDLWRNPQNKIHTILSTETQS